MIGQYLVKHLGQNFKMVCLFLTTIFFVSCAGTDPNGNNGDAGNGDTTYYYLPTQNTTVENTKPTIEPSPTTDFAPTSYLYENGNVWYGSTTSESGLRTEINNGGVAITGYHFIGTSVNIIGYSTGGTWYEKTSGSGGTGAWTEFNAVAGDPIQDLINISGNTVGPNSYWKVAYTGYPTSGPGLDKVEPFTELLYFDTEQPPFSLNMKIGKSDDNLYLFTVSDSETPFTFNLLFVKDGKEYIQVDNIQYYQEGYNPNPAPGKITAGSRCWTVDYTLPTGVTVNLKDDNVAIYMVVTKYGSFLSTGDNIKGKNVIRIK